jgi:hypothetical protein
MRSVATNDSESEAGAMDDMERERTVPPDPAATVEDRPREYDTLDEAGTDTFPGSDSIAVSETKPLPKVGDVQE